MTAAAAPRALVVLDFSGTLSVAAPRFGAPDAIAARLRACGLWDLGIDSVELFWQRLVDPTWERGSTTAAGYAEVLAGAAAEVLRERGRDVGADDVLRCVTALRDQYFAAATIAPQWRGFLQRLRTVDDTGIVVATDHYADATAHIGGELAALGVPAAPVTRATDGRSPAPVAVGTSTPPGSARVAIANSADIGAHKASAQFWHTVRRTLGPGRVHRMVMIDDFGANEPGSDSYADPVRVRRRRAATFDVLSSVFAVDPEVYPFVLPPGADAADIAARVGDAERTTMTVLSRRP